MTLPIHPLRFDTSGQPVSATQLGDLIDAARRDGATDLLFLGHGFRCDESDATALYTALLANLSVHLAGSRDRVFAVAGVYWPSQKFPESPGTTQSVYRRVDSRLVSLLGKNEGALDRARALTLAAIGNRAAQNDLVRAVVEDFGDGQDDPAEGLPLLHQWSGSELLDRLADRSSGGIDSLPLVQPILGRIDTFLNFMSWAAMKNLSGVVGVNGAAAAVASVRSELPGVRVHLAGHSLGGRLMAACCKELARRQVPGVASLSLLEAAFSHYGFSPDAGWGKPGFFRSVITSGIVSGPMISTFSKQDRVVGTAYAVASRLAHDSLQAIGDAADRYGGIGHNGAQRTPEARISLLPRAGEVCDFKTGTLHCLDGSAGLITGHGDITNPNVTYAIARTICGLG